MNARSLLLCLFTSGVCFAGSRGQYGGSLKVAMSSRPSEVDPLIADTPSEATWLGLVSRSVCSIEAEHARPVLLSEMVKPSPTLLTLSVRPGLKLDSGLAVGSKEIAESLMRVAQPLAASPYRALLYPLRGEGRQLSGAVTSRYTLELQLAFPWPDLERSLCHPALAIIDTRADRLGGLGPFRVGADKNTYVANPTFPAGRPYVDGLAATFTDERGAARLLALQKAQVVFGAGAEPLEPAPALYATYLAFKVDKVGPGFRAALESVIDRGELARSFVKGPAVAMPRLLPPALAPGLAPVRPPIAAPAKPASPVREVTLSFDAGLDDQRKVAERLQVKLHDLGFKVGLKPLPRKALRTRWNEGSYDLLLHSLLLPPVPGPALAVTLEAAGRRDLLASQLPGIGAISDNAARDQRARELADQLAPSLELIPLYAQSLKVASSPQVTGLRFDPQGLPMLDAAFLSPGPPP